MKVDSLMRNLGASIYYDPDFRNVLEAHMTYLRTHPTTVTLNIDPSKAYKYEFDLFSLFAEMNIPTYLHWLTMRMNQMTAPTDATRELDFLLVPDQTTVSRIAQSHRTTRKIS